MNVREEFLEFLDKHPKMRKDRPAPKLLYANLLEDGSALDKNIKKLGIKDFRYGFSCLEVKKWKNIIKPQYEAAYHKDYGRDPMVPGTYWNHLAAINKFIEFLETRNKIN